MATTYTRPNVCALEATVGIVNQSLGLVYVVAIYFCFFIFYCYYAIVHPLAVAINLSAAVNEAYPGLPETVIVLAVTPLANPLKISTIAVLDNI